MSDAARDANGFALPPASGMSPEDEDWVLNVYAEALRIIGECFQEATGMSTSRSGVFAGMVIVRLAHHDPPLTVERLQ